MKIKQLNTRMVAVALLGVVILLLAIFAIVRWQSRHLAVRTAPRPTASTTATPTPELEPLAIAALRARSYNPTTIMVEQELDSVGGASSQIISYHSDELKIYALSTTPIGSPPTGGWPVIVLNHGYIEPANYHTDGPEYQQFIASLTSAGFKVIKPDYRGHGRSEGQPEGGHFSPAYTYDLLNLVATLKQTPGVNGSRIGFLGHSMGAHVALRATVTSKDIKATALMSGVVGSMNDIFYNWPRSPMPFDQPRPIVQGKRLELIKKYGEPKDNPTFWDSVSAINFVSQISNPVQIHHSAGDSMVPLLFSEHLTTALKNANKSVEFYTYPGNDHQLITSRNLVLQRLTNFFKTNL